MQETLQNIHTKKENTIHYAVTNKTMHKQKKTFEMAPDNCIVEGRWYTVPPMGCFISKEALCKSKLYQYGGTKNGLTLVL